MSSLCRSAALIVFFAALVLMCRGAATASDQPNDTVRATAPNGLVVVIEDKPSQPIDLATVSNPNISGVALQIHWSDLEPAEGKPDWSRLDSLFASAHKANKWVALLVFPGFFTPPWALKDVPTGTFAIQYGPGNGEVRQLPAPWNDLYLSRWFSFLKLLDARYGNDAGFRMIAADGPTSVSAEFTLPKSPADTRQWQSLGYTPDKYVDAWRKVFQEYASDFPKQYISLSVGAGQINISNAGEVTTGEGTSTRQAIVDAAKAALGARLVLQSSNVHAGPGPNERNSRRDDAFIIDYAGRVITGLQMRTSATGASAVMGAAGDPPLALRRSVDLAMLPNANGRHIDYLEIYSPDVAAADMQAVLRYAAGLFR